jgi:hypothetical protein
MAVLDELILSCYVIEFHIKAAVLFCPTPTPPPGGRGNNIAKN